LIEKFFKHLFKNKVFRDPTESKEERERILNLLLSLGTTEEEVFNNLLKGNFYGIRLNVLSCPIANFLTSNAINTPHIWNVATNHNNFCGYYFSNKEYPELDTIRQFISHFDQGFYPELEIKVAFNSNE
jgi:hypothetical protein